MGITSWRPEWNVIGVLVRIINQRTNRLSYRQFQCKNTESFVAPFQFTLICDLTWRAEQFVLNGFIERFLFVSPSESDTLSCLLFQPSRDWIRDKILLLVKGAATSVHLLRTPIRFSCPTNHALRVIIFLLIGLSPPTCLSFLLLRLHNCTNNMVTTVRTVVGAEMRTPLLQGSQMIHPVDPSPEKNKADTQDMLMWMLHIVFLISQFSMAYSIHQEGADSVSFLVVCISIFLFVLTATLYRAVDAKSKTMVLLLLPEINFNITLALVIPHRSALAFSVLLGGSLLFSVFVIVISSRILFNGTERDERMRNSCPGKTSNDLTVCQIV